jgi:hypothetical protein
LNSSALFSFIPSLLQISSLCLFSLLKFHIEIKVSAILWSSWGVSRKFDVIWNSNVRDAETSNVDPMPNQISRRIHVDERWTYAIRPSAFTRVQGNNDNLVHTLPSCPFLRTDRWPRSVLNHQRYSQLSTPDMVGWLRTYRLQVSHQSRPHPVGSVCRQ